MVLKSCEKGEILDINNKASMPARVSIWRETVTLYLSEFKGKPGKYKKSVMFYDAAKGLVTCKCVLDIHENLADDTGEEPWKANCKVGDVQSVVNRKADVRIKVSIPIRASLISDRGPMPAFEATMRDISAGGVYFTTDYHLGAGNAVRFNLTLDDHSLSLRALVLRVKMLNENRFGYGCQFKSMQESSVSIIRGFVFKTQLAKKDFL